MSSRIFCWLSCVKYFPHFFYRRNSRRRIGLPLFRKNNGAEEDVMMSSFISEESEKELELNPPYELIEDSSTPW